jgi:hypothetical protein
MPNHCREDCGAVGNYRKACFSSPSWHRLFGGNKVADVLRTQEYQVQVLCTAYLLCRELRAARGGRRLSSQWTPVSARSASACWKQEALSCQADLAPKQLNPPGVALTGISRDPRMVRRNCFLRKHGQSLGSVGPGNHTNRSAVGRGVGQRKTRGRRAPPRPGAQDRRSHGGTGKKKKERSAHPFGSAL